MPRNGTTLYLAGLDEAGNITELLSIAGSTGRSLLAFTRRRLIRVGGSAAWKTE
jgi:hypothetical protein